MGKAPPKFYFKIRGYSPLNKLMNTPIKRSGTTCCLEEHIIITTDNKTSKLYFKDLLIDKIYYNGTVKYTLSHEEYFIPL